MNTSMEDILSDTHEVIPAQFDKRALETYLVIRSANPWLPDPAKIPADSSLELTWGANRMTTLSIVVQVDLPEAMLEDITESPDGDL